MVVGGNTLGLEENPVIFQGGGVGTLYLVPGRFGRGGNEVNLHTSTSTDDRDRLFPNSLGRYIALQVYFEILVRVRVYESCERGVTPQQHFN